MFCFVLFFVRLFCFSDGKQIWEVEATVDKDKTQAVSSFSLVVCTNICTYLNKKQDHTTKFYGNSCLLIKPVMFLLFFLFFFAFDCSSRTCFLLRSPLIETGPSPTKLRSTSLSLMGRRSAVSLSTSCIHL